MVFRMLQNGARKDLNTVATAAVNPVTGQKEIWDNFMGAPSVYFVFAVPQDGIAKPADFNASVSSYLRCLWNGSAPEPDPDVCVSTGTLTGPDGDGYYTATLTAAIIPNDAVMLTGGLGYSYNVRTTLPLTQTNLPDYPATKSTVTGLVAGMPNATGGLIVIVPNAQKVATGFTGRRAIVEDARCNACHQELGTFTEDAFHGGQRNDGTTCSWCHTPNRASSGWTAETGNMTHAIHGGAKRSVPYTWHSVSATENFSTIVYPGILARCQQCHLPGTYDFVNSASADAAGLGADQTNKRQYREVASGTLSATDISLSPYVTAGVNYGVRFSFNATTGVTTPGAGTNLVTSPTMNACVACHDSNLAVSHMTLNGGSFYEARSTAIGKQEQCFVCHASDRSASITAVHAR
jgi:OmcA/MtrC family decaheme c-type cytochrome